MSTKLVVMLSANELIATRRPFTSTSVASAPSPRRLTAAAPLAVESWLLPRVENVPLPTNGCFFEQLLQVGVAGLLEVAPVERHDRRRVLEIGRARDARAGDVDHLEFRSVALLLRVDRGGQPSRGESQSASQCDPNCACQHVLVIAHCSRPSVFRSWSTDLFCASVDCCQNASHRTKLSFGRCYSATGKFRLGFRDDRAHATRPCGAA